MNNELREEDMLPSVRVMANDLKISFLTVKKAYDELEKEGYIKSVQGKGTFVAPKNSEFVQEEKRKEIQNRSFHGNYGDDHVCNTVAVSEHHAEPVQKHRNLERRTAVRRGAAEKKQKPRKRLADRR